MINALLVIGIVLLSGFFVGRVTRRIGITAVIGYLVTGIVLGPNGFNFVSFGKETVSVLTVFTLSLVLFMMGTQVTREYVRSMGRSTFIIFLCEAGVSFIFVFFGTLYFLNDYAVALVLASLAPSTAPVSRLAVIRELRADGPVTNMTLTTLVDNAFSVVLFIVSIGVINTYFSTDPLPLWVSERQMVVELVGSIVIGVVIGGMLSVLVDEFRDKEFRFVTALAAALMSSGLALFFDTSPILASMVAGVTFVTFIPEMGDRVRQSIEDVLTPIFVLFFVFVGSSFDFDLLVQIGGLGVVYIVVRVAGKVIGSFLGARFTDAEPNVQKYFGISMLSQAGVAVGLALLVKTEVPGYMVAGVGLGELMVTIVTATSIFFELIGPLGVRYALIKSGEAKR